MPFRQLQFVMNTVLTASRTPLAAAFTFSVLFVDGCLWKTGPNGRTRLSTGRGVDRFVLNNFFPCAPGLCGWLSLIPPRVCFMNQDFILVSVATWDYLIGVTFFDFT